MRPTPMTTPRTNSWRARNAAIAVSAPMPHVTTNMRRQCLRTYFRCARRAWPRAQEPARVSLANCRWRLARAPKDKPLIADPTRRELDDARYAALDGEDLH